MGRIGKNKTLISISIPQAWRDEIDSRAAALSLTRAAYATMILERWWAEGCPAISEPDRLMQLTCKIKGAPGPAADGAGSHRATKERFLALANNPPRR